MLLAAPARAVEWFHKGCEAGDPTACRNLGALYVEGRGVPQGYGAAAVWLERSCEGNDPGGCRLLGLLLLEGKGVAKDEARARKVLGQACRGDDRPACEAMVAHGWAKPTGEDKPP